MNDSRASANGPRGRFLPALALLLLLGGVALLCLWAMQARRAGETAVAATRPPATAGSPKDDQLAGDGKVLPTAAPQQPALFPGVPAAVRQHPIPEVARRSYETLFAVIQPVHDYFHTAEELGRADFGARTMAGAEYEVGDRTTFKTNDGPRQAELVYQDDLAAYWVEVGLALDRTKLLAAAARFREQYYPMLTRAIGQEWRPGVGGELRIAVLHTLGSPDAHELGYFTDENQYPAALFPQSNEREMVYMNMSLLDQGPLYDGTLIHEAQHLIQWNLDANEDKWFNEGLSQVAETMAGLDTVDPRPYLEQTHIRLDRWARHAPELHAQYAGSYLFLQYFREQLGDAALTELARHPANGLAAVRAVLAGYRPDLSLEEFAADWATALYLDGEPADGRYEIVAHELPPPFLANRVRQLPFETVATLEQYAIDYIDLDFNGRATIAFAGDSVVELIDPPPDGSVFWFAPPANSSRSQLTAAVDLTGLSEASLEFDVWYDLEPEYDHAYFSVSIDQGRSWRPLRLRHSGVGAYGAAWGGSSAATPGNASGWLRESIDLNAYAGLEILLRFDVVTDFEEYGRGFALGGLVVPELEAQPEWRPNGFAEVGHLLPQQWAVRLIREGSSSEVIPLELDERNQARIEVELGPDGGVLVVTPLTPFVGAAAEYWLAIGR